jgi:hypothetical protein
MVTRAVPDRPRMLILRSGSTSPYFMIVLRRRYATCIVGIAIHHSDDFVTGRRGMAWQDTRRQGSSPDGVEWRGKKTAGHGMARNGGMDIGVDGIRG